MVRMVIKDEQWIVIEPFIKQNKAARGRPRVIDDRLILEAILYIMRTGLQWRELPSEFPNWKSAYSRFRTWNKNGVWEKAWSVFKKTWKIHVRNEHYFSILNV